MSVAEVRYADVWMCGNVLRGTTATRVCVCACIYGWTEADGVCVCVCVCVCWSARVWLDIASPTPGQYDNDVG